MDEEPFQNRDTPFKDCPFCSADKNAQVRAHVALETAGIGDDWIILAERCNDCGCVYIGHGRNAMIKGYLVDGRWSPAASAPCPFK